MLAEGVRRLGAPMLARISGLGGLMLRRISRLGGAEAGEEYAGLLEALMLAEE